MCDVCVCRHSVDWLEWAREADWTGWDWSRTRLKRSDVSECLNVEERFSEECTDQSFLKTSFFSLQPVSANACQPA